METPASLLVTFLVFPVVFFAFLLISLSHKKRQASLLFVQGIEYIKLLRSLLTYVQQHRGLTTGFINGNHAARKDIEALDAKIKRIIAELEVAGSWMRDNVKWSSLVDHWSRLAVIYLQADADKNFKQHNVFIVNLLYLIDDVADVHHLSKNTNDTDWRYLLSIAEYIGQARALGTGVAAKGECSSVLRIQLNHLRNKIASSIDGSWPDASRVEIQQLLSCIETQLVIEKPSIQAGDYFQLATRCIDHVFEKFDHQIERLQYLGAEG
ncbi:nitrate- and nitrite sensing domain-containing protein [Cellvibrio sp. NN19]|uniref:nitrate- and nitrite sensing domain-containing protein n=1 Tax=Cellvibrio chitinivorans TaxID=3102792 RepID=UPI002B4072CE|nr:nitrate- and nitrite sensing domain-containing protein [Cellvibrio sp. NN19]